LVFQREGAQQRLPEGLRLLGQGLHRGSGATKQRTERAVDSVRATPPKVIG
jgi:hypothetical protein